MKTDPLIYLAIDNCFASKRWTRPEDWMAVISGLGLKYIEASADTECDPLYMGADYIKDWIGQVKTQGEKRGVCVKNIYSGHGTYSTLGLAHTDERVRRHFRENWMNAQADAAAALGAGFGFFAHAFDETVLQGGAEAYSAKLEELYDNLAAIAAHGAEAGTTCVSVEQMYSPNQPPWTIDGALELMRQVYSRGNPMYITVDVGHMNGQQFFQRPTGEYVTQAIRAKKDGAPLSRVWLGSAKAMRAYNDAARGRLPEDEAVAFIMDDVAQNPQLFAQPEDGDILAWVARTGCFSPILHLQQSDGKSSPHWPFTSQRNQAGVVRAQDVLKSLCDAYAQDVGPGLPPMCGEVCLTLEPFFSTACNVYEGLDELAESVEYWRAFVPRDGMRLSELAKVNGF